MKQNTTKLGVHWPHTDFNQNGSEPLNLENIIFFITQKCFVNSTKLSPGVVTWMGDQIRIPH